MSIPVSAVSLRGGTRVSLAQPVPNASKPISIHRELPNTGTGAGGQGQEGLLDIGSYSETLSNHLKGTSRKPGSNQNTAMVRIRNQSCRNEMKYGREREPGSAWSNLTLRLKSPHQSKWRPPLGWDRPKGSKAQQGDWALDYIPEDLGVPIPGDIRAPES